MAVNPVFLKAMRNTLPWLDMPWEYWCTYKDVDARSFAAMRDEFVTATNEMIEFYPDREKNQVLSSQFAKCLAVGIEIGRSKNDSRSTV